MTKRRSSAGRPSIHHRSQSVATFTADAAAGKYNTARPSTVSVTHPPIIAVGDAVEPVTIAVTQIQYLMSMQSGSYSFSDNNPVRIGSLAFGGLAPVGQGIPTQWRNGAGVLGPAWSYIGGLFSSSENAPAFTARVEIHGTITVNVADVDLLFTLRDPNNAPPNDIVAAHGTTRIRAINSPTLLHIVFDVDERNTSQFRVLPDVQYGVYVQRTDAGAVALVTMDKYRQSLTSVGVA